MKVYVVGSLRSDSVPLTSKILREAGHDVFDDWFGAGPRADDEWKAYYQSRGFTLAEALKSPLVQHIVALDRQWLTWADAVVLAAPAGKSAHIELTWAYERDKRCVVYMPDDGEEPRWDAMYALLPHLVIATTEEELLAALEPVAARA